MKFVCDRCQTKYSIADEKVRGKVLKVRCKNCSNVVTVKEAVPGPAVAEAESDRTVINGRPGAAPAAAAPLRPSRPTPAPVTALGRADSSGRAAVAVRAPAPARTHTPPPVAAPDDGVQWFLALDGVQKGPFSRKVLVDRLVALPRNADVHVWNEDMEAWKPPRQVPALAQEMQARQRSPVPPPPPRARTMPPLPAAHTHAPPSPSGLPLGTPLSRSGHALATAGSSPDLAADFATPLPQRATNGVDGHSGKVAAGGAVAPAALSTGGESDAMHVLNLGTPARRVDVSASSSSGAVPLGAHAAPVGTAAHIAQIHAEVRSKSPRLALGFAFLAVVGICVAVLYNFVLKKPEAPSPASVAAQKGEGDKAPSAAKSETPPKEAPPGAKVAGEFKWDQTGKDEDQAGKDAKEGKEPSSVVVAGKAGAAGKKQNRGRAPHNAQGTSLEPAPFSPSAAAAAPESPSGMAARLGERRVVPIRGGGNAGGHTPDQGEITRVVNNNKGGIKVCYQRALVRDSTLTRGKIDVEISIGISGRVKKVSIDGPTAFRVLEPCIRDVISRWVFPTSSEEYVTQFSSSFQGNE